MKWQLQFPSQSHMHLEVPAECESINESTVLIVCEFILSLLKCTTPVGLTLDHKCLSTTCMPFDKNVAWCTHTRQFVQLTAAHFFILAGENWARSLVDSKMQRFQINILFSGGNHSELPRRKLNTIYQKPFPFQS